MPPTGEVRSISERARQSSAVDPQDGLFDKVIEDADLEAALEERERIRLQRLEVNHAFKTADEQAKNALVDHDISAGDVVRCGRFRIKKTAIQPRQVSFDTSGSERLNIGTIDEEA